ncbi:MAG: hypothetical protein WBF58_15430 [Xanthobacteraceae bacterium]
MVSIYWFRPKRYGYGATPITWQGWAVVVTAVVFIAAAAVLILGYGANMPGAWIVFLAVEAVVLAALWIVCRRKTDGQWRWRWGGDAAGRTMDRHS